MVLENKKFRTRIDKLLVVQMCHICKECHPAISIVRGLDGAICQRRKNVKACQQ